MLLIANEATDDVIGRCSHGDGLSPAGAAEESLHAARKQVAQAFFLSCFSGSVDELLSKLPREGGGIGD